MEKISSLNVFLHKKFDKLFLVCRIRARFCAIRIEKMKKDIHPTLHPVIFRDASAGKDFVAMSAQTSSEVEKLDGVDHYVIQLDVSSASHPFFTGKQKLVDTSGRVERFKRQQARVAK